MCGLVGVMGTLSLQYYAMFKTLLFVDAMRGPHGTGVGIYHEPWVKQHQPKSFVIKDDNPSWSFLGSNEEFRTFEKFYTVHSEIRMLMGHNRFKTVGDIKPENSHPFQHGHLIGAQNGTLDDFKYMPDNEFFEVDSDWAIWRMSEKGIAEAISEMLGAWAFTVFDTKKNKLYFTRNAKRPLYFGLTKDKKALFWASQRNMLVFAADEHGVEFDTSVDSKTGLYYLNPEDMITFDLPEKHKEVKWGSITQAKGATKSMRPFVTTYDYTKDPWGRDIPEKHPQLPAPKTPPKSSDAGPKGNVVDLNAVREAIKETFGSTETERPGMLLDDAVWDNLTQDGCGACGGAVLRGHLHKIVDRGNQVLCSDCCDTTLRNPFWGTFPKEFDDNDLVTNPEAAKALAVLRMKLPYSDCASEKRSIH